MSRACRPTCESPISPSSSFLGTQGGDRVDDDHVDRVRLDEHFGDLHRFFAVAGLADEQRSEVDAELLGPARVEGVFGVDEGGDAAGLLGLGDHVQGERGLAARFGAEDFDDAAARKALAAEGDVERQAAGRDAFDRRSLSAPSGMIEPSPNCFSMAATVLRSSGLPASILSAGDCLVGGLVGFAFSFLAMAVLEDVL